MKLAYHARNQYEKVALVSGAFILVVAIFAASTSFVVASDARAADEPAIQETPGGAPVELLNDAPGQSDSETPSKAPDEPDRDEQEAAPDDVTAPSTPGMPTAVNSSGNASSANATTIWTWAGSTDDTAVAGYEFAFMAGSAEPGAGDWQAAAGTGVNTTAPADGLYTLYVRAFDGAGNYSGVSSASIVIDTTPPALTIGSAGPVVSGGVVTLSGTMSGQAGETRGYTLLIGSLDVTSSVVVSADGTWRASVNTSRLPAGSYTVSIAANDDAGNRSEARTTLRVTAAPAAGTGSNSGGTGPLTPARSLGVPAAINPGAFQQVLGDSASDNTDAATTPVVGANQQVVDPIRTPSVLAQAIDSDANLGRFLGIGWYWWFLILAGLAALGWGITAMVRRIRTASWSR